MKKKGGDNPKSSADKETSRTASRKKMGAAIGGGIAVAAIVLLLVVLQPQQQQPVTQSTQNPKLGLVIMPPTQRPTFDQVHNSYIQAASTGIGRSNVYMIWPAIEPQEGSFNWKTYDLLMGLNREQHLNVTLYFSIINNEQLGPFPDWVGQQPAFDQRLANETASALDAVLSRYYIVDYVIIGGDLNIYFRDHPNDIPKYVSYFDSVYSQLKAKHPGVKIGNWFSLNDLINHSDGDMVQKLDQGDFVGYSYAPVDLLFYETKGPDRAVQDLQKMFDYAGDKSVGLVEIGWGTDKSVNGTAENQAKFVRDAFDFYRQNSSKMEFMTWYRQYDRPFDACQSGLNTNVSTGFGSEHLANNTAAYLCSTGLIGSDNSTKPAWDEFKSQVQSTKS